MRVCSTKSPRPYHPHRSHREKTTNSFRKTGNSSVLFFFSLVVKRARKSVIITRGLALSPLMSSLPNYLATFVEAFDIVNHQDVQRVL